MSNTYNIYRLKFEELDNLLKKINSVGLVEQKTQVYDNYEMTFFFSENIEGNDVWWHQTYKTFLNPQTKPPKNIFYFGLLICKNQDDPKEIYAVSLGKSHFYLSKFIQSDFGIGLAIRMANEQSILLKKSRYFTGTKRHDVSAYEKFNKDSYDSGESVEHLKLKASNTEVWGDKNIVFADSIQLDVSKEPSELPKILNDISDSMKDDEIIRLPKLDLVSDEMLINELNSLLLNSIVNSEGNVCIEEISISGININFRFNECNYELIFKKGRKEVAKLDIGNSLNIVEISSFVKENNISNLDEIKVRFTREESNQYTKDLKEILDFYKEYEGSNYFLKNGKWFKFNQNFMEYLKKSLVGIELVNAHDLIEHEYLDWKSQKDNEIANGTNLDKLTYREYYFNKKMSDENGYELLDRQLEMIRSLDPDGKKYKIEVADLLKDNEIISVKITTNTQDLIYNIEQSKSSLELIKQNQISVNCKLEAVALWIVYEKPISSIIEINSIQFLLALDSWKKRVQFFGLKPRVYISQHIK